MSAARCRGAGRRRHVRQAHDLGRAHAASRSRKRGQSRRARTERERRGLVGTLQAAHEVVELRIPGLGGERELLAPDRRAVTAAPGVHGRVHGLGRRERVEPAGQPVVELLLARGLVQRIEARAPHHRLADELGPGRVHRLEPGARRDLDAAPLQDAVAGELGQHRLVQLHVEMQHDRARREAGAGRERGIHDARDRDAERTRDPEQEPSLVRPHRGRHREHRLVAGRGNRTPQRPEVGVHEVCVRDRPLGRAGERILRQVRPEPVGRKHGLQPCRRGRRLADDGARRREQRDARARRETHAVPDRDDRGVDDLDADHGHRQRTWRLRSTRLSR